MNDTAFDWAGGMDAPSPEKVIKDNEAAMAKAFEDQMEVARMVFEVLEASPQGPQLMEYLDAMTIRAPLMMVSSAFVQGEVNMSPADWAYYREGQNSVVRFLQLQVALAKNPPEALTNQTGE